MVEHRESLEEIMGQALVRHAGSMADRLRSAAERIEREASRVELIGKPGVSSYASIAANVQSEVRALLGNLMFESVTTDASEADRARERRITAERIANRIDTTIGGYPDNDVERPKVERGEHLNDREWAASIAREYAAKEA